MDCDIPTDVPMEEEYIEDEEEDEFVIAPEGACSGEDSDIEVLLSESSTKKSRPLAWEDAAVAFDPMQQVPQQPGGGWTGAQLLDCVQMMITRLSETTVFGKDRMITTRRLRDLISYRLELKLPNVVWITGANGTGKTTAMKWILHEVAAQGIPFTSTYMCCSIMQKMKPHRLLHEIGRRLGVGSQPDSRSKTPFDLNELRSRFCDPVQPVVVVVDEVDAMFTAKRCRALLPLLEMPNSPGCTSTFVFISNSRHVPYTVDKKIRSRLGVEHVRFSPYSGSELYEIVRHKLCGQEKMPDIAASILSEDSIKHIASQTSTLFGDCRRVVAMCHGLLESAISVIEKIPPDAVVKSQVISAKRVEEKLQSSLRSNIMATGISGMAPHLVSMLASIHKRFLVHRQWSEPHGATCVPLMDALRDAMRDWRVHNVECAQHMCERDALVELYNLERLGYIVVRSRTKRGVPIDTQRDWMLTSLTSTETILSGTNFEPAKKIIETYCEQHQ